MHKAKKKKKFKRRKISQVDCTSESSSTSLTFYSTPVTSNMRFKGKNFNLFPSKKKKEGKNFKNFIKIKKTNVVLNSLKDSNSPSDKIHVLDIKSI